MLQLWKFMCWVAHSAAVSIVTSQQEGLHGFPLGTLSTAVQMQAYYVH